MSWRGWFALLGLGMAIWLIVQYASLLVEITGILFGAILLSLAIRPFADLLGRYRMPRGISVIVFYLGVGGILSLIGDLLEPVFTAEANRLQTINPTAIQNALGQIYALPIIGKAIPSAGVVVTNLVQQVDTLFKTFIGAIAGIGTFAIDLFIVLILAYFMSVNKYLVEHTLIYWAPKAYHPQIHRILQRLRQRLSRWVWSQVAISIYFTVVFSIGLKIIGVPFAFSIGLVGGILELIPYVGGFVAAVLATLSALTVNPILILWVLPFYLVVMEVESHLLAPALYGRVTGIHPGLVLIALLVGAKTGGVLGILFAVPVALVLLAILEETRAVLIAPAEPINEPET